MVKVLNVLLCTTGKKKEEKGPRHEKYVLVIEEDDRKQCFKLLFSNFESIVIFVVLRFVVN